MEDEVADEEVKEGGVDDRDVEEVTGAAGASTDTEPGSGPDSAGK